MVTATSQEHARSHLLFRRSGTMSGAKGARAATLALIDLIDPLIRSLARRALRFRRADLTAREPLHRDVVHGNSLLDQGRSRTDAAALNAGHVADLAKVIELTPSTTEFGDHADRAGRSARLAAPPPIPRETTENIGRSMVADANAAGQMASSPGIAELANYFRLDTRVMHSDV